MSDAAPVVAADRHGIFRAHGLDVEIIVEPSWANIADKLGYGLLEGAVMLPPLAIACALGLRGRRTDLVVPMSLSANGNALTLARKWQNEFPSGGIQALTSRQRLRLAVVHAYSTHDLLLRYWLAANGVGVDTSVEITVLSPSEMVSSLAAGAIDGFCAGAPWNHVAAKAGLGFEAIKTGNIWRNHPEKCLAMRADFVDRDSARTHLLLTALREAAAYCTSPANRPVLAALLARPEYLDLPQDTLETSLDPAEGGPTFSATYPSPRHAAWFATQMLRWGTVPENALDLARDLYRPTLYLAAGGRKPEEIKEMFCDTITAS
ncbi:MAG: ABC transporter substrate-binding protein [Rhodospirillales bacterium]|nr:ABC transporter substrate-binding protein [Rhodospirillales bacterium]